MNGIFGVSGAGSGIGRAIAVELAARGAALVLVGRSRAALEQTRHQLPRPHEHCSAAADIRDGDALRQALERCDLPHLDGIVANAGIGGENRYGSDDRWEEIISTNLTGTYVFVNECLAYLRRSPRQYRHILLTSSILARLGVPRYTAYCTSKAGLLGLMRSWAVELAAENILVNAICPGWVETEMSVEGIRQMAEHNGVSYQEAYAEQMAYVPLRKMSAPQEIARLAAFLLDQAQTSITGQTYDINNGAIMPA